MSAPIVAVAFGACTPDESARLEAMQGLHDQLIEGNPVRLGPVEWHFFGAEAAREKLAFAGVVDSPEAVGLLAFLAENPAGLICIAMVDVPAGARA